MIKNFPGILLASVVLLQSAGATPLDQVKVDSFIEDLTRTHGFNSTELQQLFAAANRMDGILEAIAKPAEYRPWYQYRPIFITQERIDGGVEFWAREHQALEAASTQYGVPPEIIVAIIGVETFYGRNIGGYRVIDALSTLAFHYPPRADFFRGELEQYLLLTREERLSPLTLKGSYAGAMGLPQFIPSSYRHYAVDFDNDGHRNIWDDPQDAIGSVGNYLNKNHWAAGEPIVAPAAIAPSNPQLAGDVRQPTLRLSEFAALGVHPAIPVGQDMTAMLLAFENPDTNDYWFGFQNFYVITRYNRSPKYALAVTQLADAIRQARAGKIP